MLDARDDVPTHALTLTTATPWEELDPANFREAMAAVMKRLRRRYGRVEYFAEIEFTTGLAPTSGGHRRMHSHNLLKFRDLAPGELDVIEAERQIRETWEAATGAYVIELAELISPGAALGYLALHHRKPEQAPPKGWSGMVERHSLGYFTEPVAELRERARAELRAEAIAWAQGVPVELAALEVASSSWSLLEVRERPDATVVEPMGEPRWQHGAEHSDWTMRRGRFVNRLTGELWDAEGRR